jgi:hypothetical protein
VTLSRPLLQTGSDVEQAAAAHNGPADVHLLPAAGSLNSSTRSRGGGSYSHNKAVVTKSVLGKPCAKHAKVRCKATTRRIAYSRHDA